MITIHFLFFFSSLISRNALRRYRCEMVMIPAGREREKERVTFLADNGLHGNVENETRGNALRVV